MNVSVILPTLWRPKLFESAVNNLLATAIGHTMEIVAVLSDEDSLAVAERLPVTPVWSPGGTSCSKWNDGAAVASQEWLVIGSDDVVWYTGWLDEAARTPNTGFIGLNEGFDVPFVGHWMMTRACAIECLGGVLMPPPYKSWWADQEVGALLHAAGRYARTEKTVMVHNHHTLGRSRDDATYANGRKYHAEDGVTFRRRQAAGFPIDWEPLIK